MAGSRVGRVWLALVLAVHPQSSTAAEGKQRMNRLAKEKSPYLLQHAANPVDWYPWGEEAFEKARKENRPIFLSIGYSTCHWCHVMEHESFSDLKIAKFMNEHFVCVKVDREERPDLDKIYMTAAIGAGWGGGWPLSLWLTPDLKPFFGGTYFPPEPRWGQRGFLQVLEGIADLWKNNRDAVAKNADQLAGALKEHAAIAGRSAAPDPSWLGDGYRAFLNDFDSAYGGFGGAPKFPMPVNQAFLLRYWARSGEKKALEMVQATLRAMAAGGVYDQVGGGFHRYSTDGEWLVPHFEKMLYDNAQLAVNYLEAYQAAADKDFARVARETLDYVLRDMTHPEGGFYSAEDADSLPPEDARAGKQRRKAEGAFYLWKADELAAALGPDAALFAYRYGVEEGGNIGHDPQGEFAGKNILHAARTIAETARKFGKSEGETQRALESAKRKLLALRSKRPRPIKDDKILASWNGLMISALSKASQVLEEPAYLHAAERGARFLRERLRDPQSGRLCHRWRDGERGTAAMADDYAFLIQGLLDLYEASFDPRWLDWSLELSDEMIKLFYDPAKGGFYMTTGSAKDLLVRVMEDQDNVEPSASSVAALDLLRLSQFADRRDFGAAADKTLERFGAQMAKVPRSLPAMLAAVDFATSKPRQIIIAGELDDPLTREMLRLVYGRFMPVKILMVVPEGKTKADLVRRLPFLKGVAPIAGKPTAYICVNYACELPTNDLQVVSRILDGKAPL